MRRHLIRIAHDRSEVLRRVMAARAVAWSDILGAGFGNPLVVDAGEVLRRVPRRAAAGELRRPENSAASSSRPTCTAREVAVPIRRPAEAGGRRLDGGARAGAAGRDRRARADRRRHGRSAAVRRRCAARPTSSWRSTCRAASPTARACPIRGRACSPRSRSWATRSSTEKLKHGAPDLVLRPPNIGIFRMLDFLQASAILRAAEPIKAEVKEKLSALL